MINTTMYNYLILICLITNFISTQQEKNQCFLLNNKLNKYNIHIRIPHKDLSDLRQCRHSITNYCCPQDYIKHIQNATIIELYRLFELNAISLYESLLRLTNNLNRILISYACLLFSKLNLFYLETFVQLIEISRNETHLVLQRGYNQFYDSYRSFIDKFFDHLLTLTYRTFQFDIKKFADELFRNILGISLTLNNNNKTILSTYFSCLWRNRPFDTILYEQLQVNLGKILQLNELLRLSNELIRVLSTSITMDHYCIDSYMQLSYCNLCSGREELPCLSNCMNVIESCLVNITLIDNVWRTFLGAIDNVAYFNNIEKILSSIGLSISDAVMTFFDSGGVQNTDIINQCGHLRFRRQTFAIDEKLSLSLVDKQLIHMSRTLDVYRSFWIRLPEQICKSNGISALYGRKCWTGTSISEDGRSSVRLRHNKPLNLKLQWILKEMGEITGTMRRTTSVLNIIDPTRSSSEINPPNVDFIIQNFTNALQSTDFDDYPNYDELYYADYFYEDSFGEMTTSSTTTTLRAITMTPIDDYLSFGYMNTADYDYADHDLYSDYEFDELLTTEQSTIITMTTTTRRTSLLPTTTTSDWNFQIPIYHRRPPIIWNINDDDKQHLGRSKQRYNSGFVNHHSSLLLLTMFISRV